MVKIGENTLNKRKRSIKNSSIHKFSQNDFQVIQENELKNPNIDAKQRKEMITVLRNNSKILTHQER